MNNPIKPIIMNHAAAPGASPPASTPMCFLAALLLLLPSLRTEAQTTNVVLLVGAAQADSMLLLWPQTTNSYEMEQTDSLDSPNWRLVGPYIYATQNWWQATVPVKPGSAFFRMHAFPVFYGKTLAQWHEAYFRWYYQETSVPVDLYGNAVLDGVVLLSLPTAPGDGTPGSINLTLTAAEPFVLPLWNLAMGDSTDPSSAEYLPLTIYQTLQLSLTLDGETLVDSSTVMQHYTQFHFQPAIPLSDTVFFVYIQGISIVHAPLAVGSHVIHLDAKNTDTDDVGGAVFEYHNTWTITVIP